MSFQQQQNGDSWTFDCQHGPAECHGNLQQSCMFNYVTDQDTYVDIITCIEDSGDITNDATVKKVKYKQSQPHFKIVFKKQKGKI